MSAPAPSPAVDNRRWIALIVVCMALLMNVLDTSIVNVALPDIQRDLGFSQSSLTWVVDAYLITFGSFLLMAGRLGDLVGRKRVFLAGIALFTLASLLCALAQTQGLLIGARFLQGLGGAVSSSVIVALIITEFPQPAERAKAMSAYLFAAVGGGSLGLAVGGVLVQVVDWHWIFAINLPIGVATLVFGQRLLEPDTLERRAGGVDVLGSVLVTAALMVGIYAIVKVPEHGWGGTQTLGLGAVAVALLVAFFASQARRAHPIMPLRILRVPGLMASSALRGFSAAGMYSVFFLGALYLERIRHYDPIEIGLAFLPMTIVVAVLSLGITARLIARFGAPRVAPAGMLCLIAALLMLSGIDVDSSYVPDILVPFALFGFGAGLTFLPLLSIAMADVPPGDAGLASGIVNVSMQISAAVGLAVLGTLATHHTDGLLADGRALPEALTDGYQLAFLVGAVAVAVGLAATPLLLGTFRRRPAHEGELQTEPA